MIAITTVAAVPTDTDALADFPRLHSFTKQIDNSNHLVSRYTRILKAGPEPFLNQGITVTNTACFDLNPHPSRLRLGNIPLNEF